MVVQIPGYVGTEVVGRSMNVPPRESMLIVSVQVDRLSVFRVHPQPLIVVVEYCASMSIAVFVIVENEFVCVIWQHANNFRFAGPSFDVDVVMVERYRGEVAYVCVVVKVVVNDRRGEIAIDRVVMVQQVMFIIRVAFNFVITIVGMLYYASWVDVLSS